MKTPPKIPLVPVSLILQYEIHASWWAGWLPFAWMNTLAGRYYAQKVRRKYARYLGSVEMRKELGIYQQPK